MEVRNVLLGRVGAAIGWLGAGGEEAAEIPSREGRRTGIGDEIVGSPASGYHSEGSRFYTWQPERAEVVDWVEELAPWDHPPRTSQQS